MLRALLVCTPLALAMPEVLIMPAYAWLRQNSSFLVPARRMTAASSGAQRVRQKAVRIGLVVSRVQLVLVKRQKSKMILVVQSPNDEYCTKLSR